MKLKLARQTPGQSWYPWLVVTVLVVVYTSSFIDRTILSLMVRPIRASLGISDTEFSYLTGFAFVIMYSIAGVPFGEAVDRWSRRGLIALGAAAWSCMTALCGLANSYSHLFAARIGVGVGEATLSPAAYSLVSDYFPRERLSRALSVFALGVPIGGGLALIIGGPLVQTLMAGGARDLPLIGVRQPWQMVFLTIGLPGVLLSLLTLLVVREPARHDTRSSEQAHSEVSFGQVVAHLWRRRAIFGPTFLGMGLYAVFGYAANTWYPAFLQRVWGFNVAEAGLMLGTSTLILGVLGAMTSGWVSDRLIARGCTDGHLRVGIVYVTGLFLCGFFGALVPVRWLSLALISATAFFAFTWLGSCTALVQIATPNRMRGRMSAIYLFFINLISVGCGPTAVAYATDHVFGRDEAVGSSLALVAALSLGLSVICLLRGLSPVRKLLEPAGSDAARTHVASAGRIGLELGD